MSFAAEIATTHKALANLDLAIIGVYFLIVFGIGFYFSRRERTKSRRSWAAVVAERIGDWCRKRR